MQHLLNRFSIKKGWIMNGILCWTVRVIVKINVIDMDNLVTMKTTISC